MQTLRDKAVSEGVDIARLSEALTVADQAVTSMKDMANTEPGRRLAALRATIADEKKEAERDREFLNRLNEIRTTAGISSFGRECYQVDERYAGAFRSFGLDIAKTSTHEAVSRLQSRPKVIQREVIGILDDWLSVLGDPGSENDRARRVLAWVRELDPDAERNQLRALSEKTDAKARLELLRQMASRKNVIEFSPDTARLLASRLSRSGDESGAIRVLRASVVEHPSDLWTNYELGDLLRAANPPQAEEAIRYYSAARAIRPEAGVGLARMVAGQGREEEAEATYRAVVRLRPQDVVTLSAFVYLLKNHQKEAEVHVLVNRTMSLHRKRLADRLNDAVTHLKLGLLLGTLGGRREGEQQRQMIEEFREAARLDPKKAVFHECLARALVISGDHAGGIGELRELIRLKPAVAWYHRDLALMLHVSGDKVGESAELREAERIEAKSREGQGGSDQVDTNGQSAPLDSDDDLTAQVNFDFLFDIQLSNPDGTKH